MANGGLVYRDMPSERVEFPKARDGQIRVSAILYCRPDGEILLAPDQMSDRSWDQLYLALCLSSLGEQSTAA